MTQNAYRSQGDSILYRGKQSTNREAQLSVCTVEKPLFTTAP